MSLLQTITRRVFSILTITLLLLQSALSQYTLTGLDDYLQKNQKALGNKFAVLVYKDGKIAYQKLMGEFNAKTQAPIAGAGNWLTVALVMIFVDQGKISLDDPVSKYLPVFDKYMKSYVTIRHCLSNTTGIENDGGKMRLLPRKKFTSLEEEVNTLAAKEISTNPGEEFHYGNIGLNIAGRVLEVITKKSFDRLIQERLLRPLKMRATNFVNEDGGAVSPSTGARSTANDYINFLSMLLNNGMFEGKQIISEESIKEMQKPQFVGLPVKYSPKEAEGLQHRLGHWTVDTDGQTTLTSPSLAGTWPFIDKCRNYACIILVQNPLKEDKKETFLQVKNIIDGQIPCK
ncbi:MAG: beta-lactamase family protein [Chitinophagaceae bacterium]|nr:beta-lactamase family protein [Chitinophagaceae bacterium]